MYRLLIILGYVFPIVALSLLVFSFWYCHGNVCWDGY
ncbi:Uncharacterised protein [Moraxella catarrhalis]|nr:Uncharacterised protein [Moraxella catarrhalis]